tara:strand:- start:368 stop:685 length:318 start_codon:yes stop_codon:yes gene_type:complete
VQEEEKKVGLIKGYNLGNIKSSKVARHLSPPNILFKCSCCRQKCCFCSDCVFYYYSWEDKEVSIAAVLEQLDCTTCMGRIILVFNEKLYHLCSKECFEVWKELPV